MNGTVISGPFLDSMITAIRQRQPIERRPVIHFIVYAL